MKVIKNITLLFAIMLLSSNFVEANNSGYQETRTYSTGKTVYQRKSINHNSKDADYELKRAEEAKARNFTRYSSVQNERYIRQTYETPKGVGQDKDGSMFGGDCSNGKCREKGRGTSILGDVCTKAVKGQCFKACRNKCDKATKGPCLDKCAVGCSSCQKPKEVCNRCDGGFCAPSYSCPPDDDYLEKSNFVQDYVKTARDDIYDALHKCQDLAPIELKYVDFRIKQGRQFAGFSNKLGNYRFRIFGCRRFDKTANLNQGRVMQKDLQFMKIFEDMMSDCYNITKTPDDLCLPENKKPLPEYVLTAEITDYFMNVCDGYDWENAAKEDLRTGSSEMTVRWRVMNVTGSEVFWTGETTGYGELNDGEYNGESVLVERAFADAVNTLRNMPKFNEQLSKRISPKVMQEQRQELIEIEQVTNPIKCGLVKKEKVAKIEKKCGIKTVCYEVDTCQDEIIGKVEDTDHIQIEECSGVRKGHSYITEDSGSSSSASTYDRGAVIIDEDGGVTSDGRVSAGEIDEDGGYYVYGEGIDEDGGIISDGKFSEGEIDEASGYSESGSGTLDDVSAIDDSILPYIDEASGYNTSGMFEDEHWVDIVVAEEQQSIVEDRFIDDYNSLCIIDRMPYDDLSPENLYKVRLSVVSVKNKNGGSGSGLIISDNFIMTSANLLTLDNNAYDIETINGTKYEASAFRVSPSKNVALLVLDRETKYFPLSLDLDLPPVGRSSYMTVGLLDFLDAEGKVDDKTTISSYRYMSDDKVEIVANSKLQKSTLGSVLANNKGVISGMSIVKGNGYDSFMPISDALKSVGLRICDKPFPEYTPWYEKATKPKVSTDIDNYVKPKAPEEMAEKDRK